MPAELHVVRKRRADSAVKRLDVALEGATDREATDLDMALARGARDPKVSGRRAHAPAEGSSDRRARGVC